MKMAQMAQWLKTTHLALTGVFVPSSLDSGFGPSNRVCSPQDDSYGAGPGMLTKFAPHKALKLIR